MEVHSIRKVILGIYTILLLSAIDVKEACTSLGEKFIGLVNELLSASCRTADIDPFYETELLL